MKPSESQVVQLTLPTDVIDYLSKQAADKQTSPADILQRAIANDRMLRDSQSDGAKLVIEKKGKPVSELKFS